MSDHLNFEYHVHLDNSPPSSVPSAIGSPKYFVQSGATFISPAQSMSGLSHGQPGHYLTMQSLYLEVDIFEYWHLSQVECTLSVFAVEAVKQHLGQRKPLGLHTKQNHGARHIFFRNVMANLVPLSGKVLTLMGNAYAAVFMPSKATK